MARPVLYLDLDHTLVSWRGGSPHAGRGAREFVLWALERYEVRWLTTWCPDGRMGEGLLQDLARMLGVSAELLQHIRGCDWTDTGTKLNGVAWLEHIVLERPFLWIEDEYGVGARELGFLDEHGFSACYHRINVTKDPESLRRLHAALQEEAPLAAHP